MIVFVKKWPIFIITLVIILSSDGGLANKTIQNILTFSPTNLKSFLNSFDTIVSDCDGVLWNIEKIPGVKEVISLLKTMGKKIYFVSNNSAKSKEETESHFNDIGIELDPKDLIFPATVMIDYLKRHNFTKSAYVVASPEFIQKIDEAGISYITEGGFYITDTYALMKNVTKYEADIGAVVLDMNVNINYYSIAKVVYLLRNPNILYLVTSEDNVYKRMDDFNFPGFRYFSKLISEISGRSPIVFGKPSESLKQIVLKQFNIVDPKRTLFIGDQLIQDMGFASVCGFQKLFVLSGGNSLKDAINTNNPAHIPDFWIESLGHLENVLE